jgi:hypothetical protein
MFQYFRVVCTRSFLWGWNVHLGEFDWRLVRVRLLIPCFLVAQAFDGRSETQLDQRETLWHIIDPRNPLPPPVIELFALRIVFIL